MAGEVSIVNRALTKLGAEPIASLADPVKEAQVAASLYATVRDVEIQKHPWHFAKARDSLSTLRDKPAFGWAYQYLLPSDFLRALRVGGGPLVDFCDFHQGEGHGWTLEGRNILTNSGPPLDLLYLRRVEDPTMFPPAFVEVLACKLAVEMAESLPGSGRVKETAWKEYEAALRDARRDNAMQLPPQPVDGDSWEMAFIMGGS